MCAKNLQKKPLLTDEHRAQLTMPSLGLNFTVTWSVLYRHLACTLYRHIVCALPLQLPRTSHISSFMFDHLHWLPLIARIQLKILTLIYRSHIGEALRYLRDLIRLPSSAISPRPL